MQCRISWPPVVDAESAVSEAPRWRGPASARRRRGRAPHQKQPVPTTAVATARGWRVEGRGCRRDVAKRKSGQRPTVARRRQPQADTPARPRHSCARPPQHAYSRSVLSPRHSLPDWPSPAAVATERARGARPAVGCGALLKAPPSLAEAAPHSCVRARQAGLGIRRPVLCASCGRGFQKPRVWVAWH